MPVLTRDPASNGTFAQWETVTGGTIAAVLADASDSTFLQQNTASSPFPTPIIDSVFLTAMVDGVAHLNSVTGHGRTGVSTHQMGVGARLGGVSVAATSWSNASIADHSVTLPRPGGGSYSVDDLKDSSLELLAIVHDQDGSQTSRFYKAWMEVDYDASGGFFAIMTGLLVPLAGAGLILRELPGMLHRAGVRRLRFKPHELERLLAHIRAPRPRFVFLGAR